MFLVWKLRGIEGISTLFTGFTAKAFNVIISAAVEQSVESVSLLFSCTHSVYTHLLYILYCIVVSIDY